MARRNEADCPHNMEGKHCQCWYDEYVCCYCDLGEGVCAQDLDGEEFHGGEEDDAEEA